MSNRERFWKAKNVFNDVCAKSSKLEKSFRRF